nr:EOG090X0O5J [Sida crystallina]
MCASGILTRRKNVKVCEIFSRHHTLSCCKEVDNNDDEPAFVPEVREKTINQVVLLGRVGVNPVRKGSPEHPAVTFSLATSQSYGYSSGDIVHKTDWHQIVVFKPPLVNLVANYLTKGQRALVQGRIVYNQITDSGGHIKTSSSIVADEIVFLSSKKG